MCSTDRGQEHSAGDTVEGDKHRLVSASIPQIILLPVLRERQRRYFKYQTGAALPGQCGAVSRYQRPLTDVVAAKIDDFDAIVDGERSVIDGGSRW